MPALFQNAIPKPGDWIVTRHGGRRTDKERQICVGPERMARSWFANEALKLRQGTVTLINGDGVVIDRTWAPNLRTRTSSAVFRPQKKNWKHCA